MTTERFPVNHEDYDELVTVELAEGETYQVDPSNTEPALSRDDSYERFGIDAEVCAIIKPSPNKTLYAYDASDYAEPYEMLGDLDDLDEENTDLRAARFFIIGDKFHAAHNPFRDREGIIDSDNWKTIGPLSSKSRAAAQGIQLRSIDGRLQIRRPENTTPTSIQVGPGVDSFETWGKDESAPIAAPERKGLPAFETGIAEKALKGQDASLLLEKEAVFGVFDGMGGEANGDVASQTAARVVREQYQGEDPNPETEPAAAARRMKQTLQAAGDAVAVEAPGGGTTGTAFQILPPSEEYMAGHVAWASAGDSRLYLLRGKELSLITTDEGYENFLDNYLGGGRYERSHTVQQSGHFAVQHNDILIAVTDGITGDKGADLMSDDEIIKACSRTSNPQMIAVNLLINSRKRDDKTAIVVRI